MVRLLIPALALSALAGCIDTAAENEREMNTSFELSEAQYPGYCRQQAAERFDVNPGDIAMESPETDGGMTTVAGSTANGALSFTCSFAAGGEFVGLGTTG